MLEIESFEVPIEIRALKTASVYIIRNEETTILVDTGMRPGTEQYLKSGGIDPSEIDLIILTHLHIDHIGGASDLQSKYGIPVGMGKADIDKVDFIRDNPAEYERDMVEYMEENGLPEIKGNAIRDHNPVIREHKYYSSLKVDHALDSKFTLSNDRDISIFDVPGHSPGSISIIVKSKNALFSGDHILKQITPNISFYDREMDMLQYYMTSLEYTKQLNLDYAYPGHGAKFSNLNGRIDSLLNHHKQRLLEVESLIGEWKSAYEVAKSMRWSRDRPLDSMNYMEQNFAIGEAIAHLRNLYYSGRADQRVRDNVIEFVAV